MRLNRYVSNEKNIARRCPDVYSIIAGNHFPVMSSFVPNGEISRFQSKSSSSKRTSLQSKLLEPAELSQWLTSTLGVAQIELNDFRSSIYSGVANLSTDSDCAVRRFRSNNNIYVVKFGVRQSKAKWIVWGNVVRIVPSNTITCIQSAQHSIIVVVILSSHL